MGFDFTIASQIAVGWVYIYIVSMGDVCLQSTLYSLGVVITGVTDGFIGKPSHGKALFFESFPTKWVGYLIPSFHRPSYPEETRRRH